MIFANASMKSTKENFLAIIDSNKVVKLESLMKSCPKDMISFIEKYNSKLQEEIHKILKDKNIPTIAREDIVLLSPIPYPRRNVFCLGKNYIEHANEIKSIPGGDNMVPKEPIYFTKLAYPCMGPEDIILSHKSFTNQLDYEVELTIIIGKKGTNIVKEEDDSSDFDDYIIKEFDGFTVGIFGISTTETKVKSHPNNTVGIKFENEIEATEKVVAELEDKVDVIVGLFHVGIDEESDITTVDVAEAVDGIDIIVDGHSHHQLQEGMLVNDTLIVQAYEWTKNVGVVEVTIEDGQVVDKEARLITLEEALEIEPNAEIVAAIAEIEAENDTILKEVIGSAALPLVGERDIVRTGESNLGNLITDIMLEVGEADVAITNGGGIRASIEEGEITLEDVLTTFPFTNYPVVLEVTGQTIVDALDYGIDAYPESAGKFPHVAGMTYKIDTSGEANKAVDVMIAGEPVDLEANYKLVTNDFMAVGGDGYTMFADATILAEYGLLSEVLADYIRTEGEIAPAVEGRITVVEGAEAVEEPVEEAVEVPVEEAIEEEVGSYTVVRGDTLWRIGLDHGTTYQVLAEFNNIANPHLIFPGQIILLPN